MIYLVRMISLQLILFLFIGCGNDSYKSEKVSSNITIDGLGEDWADIPLNYIEDMGMVIGFVNDDSVLYGMFRFSDHLLACKIHLRGAILWIDPQQDEEKRFGIRYRRDFSGPPPDRDNARRDPSEQKEIDLNGSFMVVQGEDKISSGMEFFPGVSAAAGNDKSLYVFEFAVPLNSDADGVLREIAAGTRMVGIGIEISAMSEEERKEMKRRMAERGGGDRSGGGMKGSGMHGGGRSGGGRGGMMGGRENMPDMDSEEIWMTVQLSR